MFLKEMIEVGWFFEAQAIADLRNIPVGVFEQGLGFACQSLRDMFCSGFAGGKADGAVEVIDMHGQLLRKIPGGAKGKALADGFNGELPFQEFGEYGGDA